MSPTKSIWELAEEGDLQGVVGLVQEDAGLVDAENEEGKTPLIEACEGGHLEVVRWLLDRGADINHQGNGGCTTLYWASNTEHTPVVRLLLEKGADPTIANTYDVTPLIVASYEGHTEIVRCLLDHPTAASTINLKNQFGHTALWLACSWGHCGAARALLEAGADPTIADPKKITPMAIAKKRGRGKCVAALEVRP
jgi:ankyrin repeat protein